MPRRLSLSRETLAELTPDDLAVVAGGAQTPNCPHTVNVRDCLSLYPYCIQTDGAA